MSTHEPTEAEIEAAARSLAGLEDGEPWPSNEALGGGLTGTRDDEYRNASRADARAALIAAAKARELTDGQ